eukprot:1818110-Amphidinium_carterae.1
MSDKNSQAIQTQSTTKTLRIRVSISVLSAHHVVPTPLPIPPRRREQKVLNGPTQKNCPQSTTRKIYSPTEND